MRSYSVRIIARFSSAWTRTARSERSGGCNSDRGAAGGSPARGLWRVFRTARKWRRWSARHIRLARLSAALSTLLLERLLAGRGLLFVDPLDESVRRLAAPLLQEAVRQDESLHAKLIERGKAAGSGGVSRSGARGGENIAGVSAGPRASSDFAPAERRVRGERETNGRAEVFGGGADRPRGTIVAERVVAAGGPGLRAADGRIRRWPRGIGIHGAVAGAVSGAAGPDAGDGVAQRIYAARRAHAPS